MSGPTCPHCGTRTARAASGGGCGCAVTRENKLEDAEPFERAWIRPYIRSSDGAPYPYAYPYSAQRDPGAEAPITPGPVLGIMQASVSPRPAHGPEPEQHDPFAPVHDAQFAPYPPPGGLAPSWESFPAEPGPPHGDDTISLRAVVVHDAYGADQGPSPGSRRARRRAGSARHAAVRSQSVKVAGAVAVLAAVVGAATLTGAVVETGVPVERAAPRPTSSAGPLPAPTPTSVVDPVPALRPSGTSDQAADGEQGEAHESAAASATTPSPSQAPPTPSPSDRTTFLTAPEPADGGGGSPHCSVAGVPGSPCPSDSRSASPAPSPTPAGLCCGATGPEVADLQFRLRELGIYKGRVNGVFNARLTDSVASYQMTRRITADPPGSYGPATRAALRREVPDIVVP
ncbi:peptidoglycan-binding protein [Streptomyces cyaneofuscatus]|uniref:peptidoglycan-binding domain-containing protein n=1 Tax=Streptomyces cyaneofuscatus TaxID=66883 RepID=UPI0033F183CA